MKYIKTLENIIFYNNNLYKILAIISQPKYQIIFIQHGSYYYILININNNNIEEIFDNINNDLLSYGYDCTKQMSNNYYINSTDTVNGFINQVHVLVNFYFNDKLYDRTQVTSLNSYTISGLLTTENISISSFTAYYRNYNVNSNK